MADVGLRVNEVSHLDLADVKWDLGRFGKLHVRLGKSARGFGPRERMVPLVNGAGATLCCFIQDVWFERPQLISTPELGRQRSKSFSCGRYKVVPLASAGVL